MVCLRVILVVVRWVEMVWFFGDISKVLKLIWFFYNELIIECFGIVREFVLLNFGILRFCLWVKVVICVFGEYCEKVLL